ncbi:MAG: DUF4282 domain-containing protein [Pseudomonadota bacterium]
MGDIAARFMSFDRMMGKSLLEIVYFIGLTLIAIGTVLSMLGSLGAIGSNALAALGGFFIAPLLGALSAVFWRFICEIYMVLFKISDDLTEIKAMKGAGTTPDTSS